jgi:hypothetical protein
MTLEYGPPPRANRPARPNRQELSRTNRPARPTQQELFTLPPDDRFWQLWAAGTFGPLGFGIVLPMFGLSSPLIGWAIRIGILLLVANGSLAVITGGYQDGEWADMGRGVAQVTGWIGAALVGLLVLTAASPVVIVAIVVVGIFAVLKSIAEG